MLIYFRYAAELEQEEVDSTTRLHIATNAAKELDSLLDAGRGACASLHIAGASNISATGLS
jgi:hypothetical protein